jgi:hypothetical protein
MVRILENYIDAIPHIVFTLKGSNIKLPLILIFESRILGITGFHGL